MSKGGGGETLRFISYAIQGFLDGLRDQFTLIRKQVLDVVWRDYVYEKFRGRKSATQHRRRDLLLEISSQAKPVKMSELRMISPGVAEAYAAKSDKTLSRDVQALKDQGLLKMEYEGIVARKEIILAFLPVHASKDSEGKIK